MGLADKAKNKIEELGGKAKEGAGKAKEGAGKATDDRGLENGGKWDQAKANVKQIGEKVKDVFKD